MILERTINLEKRTQLEHLFDQLLKNGYVSKECPGDRFKDFSNQYTVTTDHNFKYKILFVYNILIEVPDQKHELLVDMIITEHTNNIL